jgi:ATP-dependent helicase/nuclease subunit B
VLDLRKLDAIDETPAAAERGTMIHKALERFVQQFPDDLPDDATARDVLIKCGQQAFGEMLQRPGVRSFWWPRFERIADWFIEFEKRRRALGAKVLSEQNGTLTIDAPGGKFVLTAKADRLEVMPGEALVVGDYKTGRVPTSKQVAAGLSPQLTLEAAIALAGGFPGVTVRSVDDLLYIALKGGVIAGEEKSVDPGNDKTPDQLVAMARAGFEKFVAEYDSPDMPYLSRPHVLFERMTNDYDHLARVKEWSQGDDDDIFPS